MAEEKTGKGRGKGKPKADEAEASDEVAKTEATADESSDEKPKAKKRARSKKKTSKAAEKKAEKAEKANETEKAEKAEKADETEKPKAKKKARSKKKGASKPAGKKSEAAEKTKKAEAAEKAEKAEKKAPSKRKAAEKPATKKRATSQGAVHFVTGFPGFIGTRLVKRLAEDDPKARFILLVEPRIAPLAEATVHDIESELPGFRDRSELVPGDITHDRLDIAPERFSGLLEEVTTVWHLAAIYDLAVEAQLAYRVNVVGTTHVLDFCEACSRLERLNYVSTCYVSGDRTGLITESELDESQGHKNHYERTKFWAEVEVQRRLDEIPTTIFRPGIVVGDSRTGETDKYDGPYYLITFLLRTPSWFPMINVGRGDALVNLVPVDFLIDAMAAISRQEKAIGKVFHLADANPMRARDIISMTLKILGRRRPVATVPPRLFERLLDIKPVRRLMGMPRESVAYFNHMARYDVTHTLEHLADTSVRCPHLSTYLATLVEYVQRNPKKTFLDGREQ